MGYPREILVILAIFGLFVIVDIAWNVYAFRRLRRNWSGFVGDLKDIGGWVAGKASLVRDRFRAWHDPDFRRRWQAIGDYRHAVAVIQRLRERTAQHYVRSEQSSFEHVRRHHAGLHHVMEASIPEVAEGMAYYIAGMTDEEIGFVAADLSRLMADPKAVDLPDAERIVIGPERFADFLRSERALLLAHPRLMEGHAERLEDFICREAERSLAASTGKEAGDAVTA